MSITLTYKDGSEREYDSKSSLSVQLGGMVKATINSNEGFSKASLFLSRMDTPSIKGLNRLITIEIDCGNPASSKAIKRQAQGICSDMSNKWSVVETTKVQA